VKLKKTDEFAIGIAYKKSGVIGIFFLWWAIEIYL
jgi:hypothetical protein